jgi:hypothetical protein
MKDVKRKHEICKHTILVLLAYALSRRYRCPISYEEPLTEDCGLSAICVARHL